MTSNFQQHHGAMLLKYSGISFISGAVNHGFFSGERSLWTALVGMVLFVLGAWLEHRWQPDSIDAPQSGLMKTLAIGSLLSVGLGFFTGGLQHFPDSPERSAWVVPLGFFVSVLALGLSAPRDWTRAASVYVLVLGTLTSVGSWGAWQWLKHHPEWAATGHAHGHSHGDQAAHGAYASDTHSDEPVAQVVSRSIEVRMDDQMRFTPSQIEVRAGETIRFVVHNAGQVEHEMVLGHDEAIREHAEAMKRDAAQGKAHGADHHHGTGAAISVAAGQTGELVVSFPNAGTLQMACLIPGHYEAGMKGTLTVGPSATGAAARAVPAPAAPAHDHKSHRH
jgi:uncharacterized cupredoxin-like copper-binding protein